MSSGSGSNVLATVNITASTARVVKLQKVFKNKVLQHKSISCWHYLKKKSSLLVKKYPWSRNKISALSSKLSFWTSIPRYGKATISVNPVKTKLPGIIVNKLRWLSFHTQPYLRSCMFFLMGEYLKPQASEVNETVCHSHGTSHLSSIRHSDPPPCNWQSNQLFIIFFSGKPNMKLIKVAAGESSYLSLSSSFFPRVGNARWPLFPPVNRR